MFIDYILIKENYTEFIVIGNYHNKIRFILDDKEVFPDKINKIWRFDKKDNTYFKDSYRISIAKNFLIMKVILNNSKLNMNHFKNLKKGRYEYYKYDMYLDENKIFIHKKNFIGRR